jgi:hypothetical protein
MMQAYQDVMAFVWNKGILNVFLTFICNLNWHEIIIELEPNQTAFDRLDFGHLRISDEGESPFQRSGKN